MPHICCDGDLTWTGIKPGATVTGSFTIENCGGAATELSWEVEIPTNWGTWDFTPQSGTGLTPEEGPVTIDVVVIAPPENDKEFTEKVKVFNTDTPSDYCEIDVYLQTPRNILLPNTLFFRILERYPHAFPILRQLFGL